MAILDSTAVSVGGLVERAGEIAAEFVRLKVDVIVTRGDAQALAAKRQQRWSRLSSGGRRSGRQRSGGKPSAPRRQRHRLVSAADRYRGAIEILREVVPGYAGWRSLAISPIQSSPRSCRRCRQQLTRPGLDIISSDSSFGTVTATRARRIQKDQLRAARTTPSSHSGRQASSRRSCCHKESAVASRLPNLPGREFDGTASAPALRFRGLFVDPAD